MSTPSDPNPQDRPAHDPHTTPPTAAQPPAPQPEYGQPAAPAYNDPSYNQPASNQPGYGQPAPGGYGGAPAAAPSNGLGVAALVLGIVALLFCWVPFLGGLVALIGLILGFIARGKVRRGQATNGGMALIGIILSVLALIVNIVIVAGVIFIGTQLEDCTDPNLSPEEVSACLEENL